jgi:putative membrane protein
MDKMKPVDDLGVWHGDSGAPAMPNPQDLAFVQQATASGLAEVSEGQIAIAKSSNPAVRNFGQRMVTDHTAANNQLSAIAAQEHIQQSPVLTGSQQQDIVTLEILSDPQFTRTYLDMQVFDHIETVRQFFQETTTGQDPTLRAFALQQLPTLVQHLDSAVALDVAGRGLPPTSATVNAVISTLGRICGALRRPLQKPRT